MTDPKHTEPRVVVTLKPCPFCGGEPSLLADATHSTAWEIECPGISCSVRPSVWEDDKQSAIAAWNTRTAAEAASREAVEKWKAEADLQRIEANMLVGYLAASREEVERLREALGRIRAEQSETFAYQADGYAAGFFAAQESMRVQIRAALSPTATERE